MPTTASTTSASMGTGLVLSGGAGQRSAPAWMGSPSGTSVTGHALPGGQASDQASWWARPVPATTTDKSSAGHAEAVGSASSHTGSPAPSLAVLHPGAPQRHSQISLTP